MHNPIYLKLHDPDEVMILLNIALLKDPSSTKIKDLIKEYSQNLPLGNVVDFVAQAKKMVFYLSYARLCYRTICSGNQR